MIKIEDIYTRTKYNFEAPVLSNKSYLSIQHFHFLYICAPLVWHFLLHWIYSFILFKINIKYNKITQHCAEH